MHQTTELVCMSTTYAIFRYYQVFPEKGKELNPGIVFYLKFVFVSLLSSVTCIGCVLHLCNTIKSNEYNHIDLDLTFIVSMLGGYLLIVLFFVKTNDAARMLIFLSNFEEFGKPIGFDKCNKLYNTISKYHYVYLLIILTTFLLTSNLLKVEQCRRENLEYGFHEVCGLVTYTWVPFEIDYFPVKQIYVSLQLFSVYYLYAVAGVNAFSTLETIEHIVVRLDHVKHIFIEAINEENSQIRRQHFNFAVKYHARVLQLEKELNECYSNCMVSHMALTGAILGCGVFGFSQAKSIPSLLTSIGWLIGLVIICKSGQILTDKSLEIESALYNSKWYTLETSLQRDIRFVIMRIQKPMVLRAAAFGIMNHAMIVTISRAAYSFITLLSQTT